jgi:DNA-binding GntR family transcriptional regulator
MLEKPPTVARTGLLRDQVYELIFNDIRSDFLPPGQRLLEVALAERYGVSRTPVREALIRLRREGFIDLADRGGYVVVKPDRKSLLDRLFVRSLLDPEVARRAAIDATPEELTALRASFAAQERAHNKKDAALFNQENENFRRIVRFMCGNATLAKCAAEVDEQFRMGRSEIHKSRENRERTLLQSRKLLEAIVARKPDMAASRMQSFLAELVAETDKK